jgi:hypothetical protein
MVLGGQTAFALAFLENTNSKTHSWRFWKMSTDIKPEILTSPSFFLKTPTSDIEQRRRLRVVVEAMTPEQQKALLTILTQSRETKKSASD